MSSRSLIASIALACASVLAVPATGYAITAVQITPAGELRADDFRGEPDKVDIRFEPASVSGTVDRFVVENTAGAGPLNATCTVLVSPNSTACNAAGVSSIGVGLSLGDDVVSLASAGPAAIPAAYRARISGGEGNDVLQSAGADDRLRGDAGRDILAGGLGDDDLAGGSGSDGLIGFEGDDMLSGGPGKDALFGQKGRDSFKGGTGNDVLLARDRRRDELIDCGPGSLERAVRDRVDPPARSCPPPKGRGKKKPSS